MDDLTDNAESKKIADMLRQQQLQQMMQKFALNPSQDQQTPLSLDDNSEPPLQTNFGSPFYIAGGQMRDIPTPKGIPAGFYNPPMSFQQGVNVTPLMVGANIPVGEGNLTGNVLGTNVNAPNYSKTGINQVGLGYSAPVGGGTLSANVNIPTQGNNYNAMLRYNKQF